MKWPLILVVAATLFCGCRCQAPPAADPFFGRTTVEPPGTGYISAGPVDPYYGAPPPAVRPGTLAPQAVTPYSATPNTLTPTVPRTGAGVMPNGSGVTPLVPGGGSQGSGLRGAASGNLRTATRVGPAIRIPPPSFTAPTPTRADRGTSAPNEALAADSSVSSGDTVPTLASSATPASGNMLAGRERVIRILQPRPKTPRNSTRGGAPVSLVKSTPTEPRRLNVPTRAVDIMDLPKAGERSISGISPASGGSGFRMVAATAPSEASSGESDSGKVAPAVASSVSKAGAGAAAFAPPSHYSYDPDYQWLRGKLEYSQIDRRWKLRYIPLDGETDEFGGSVVLPDASLLSGCERGDFVELRGQLGRRNPKKGFAPTYQVADVKRL